LCQNSLTVDRKHPRITRESKTIAVMIDLYCHSQHGSDGLCSECSELLVYAKERLEKCPFQEGKTTCAKCPVHCFKPAMRDKIRTVMRYSGPRMLHRHPILAIHHFSWIDQGKNRFALIKKPQIALLSGLLRVLLIPVSLRVPATFHRRQISSHAGHLR